VRTQRDVLLHFDVVSPYSWIALMRAERFAADHGVRWIVRPVVYAALLEAHGLVGPVEVPAKRRYTFVDVQRSAARAGLRLAGPPAHPFRSIEALRTICLFADEPGVLDLAAGLADAAWGDGRSLTDSAVLADIVAHAGLDARNLAERISDERVKSRLRSNTDEALRLGVFGVPTFVLDGELFWGHDRLEHLAERLDGRSVVDTGLLERMLGRPQAVERRRQGS
jgi:2-hydroxychromene-2-carboxylate isomerase